jgi:hypothetical protein
VRQDEAFVRAVALANEQHHKGRKEGGGGHRRRRGRGEPKEKEAAEAARMDRGDVAAAAGDLAALRLERRRLRNKKSAKRSRDQRREAMLSMRKRISQLEREHEQALVDVLRLEVALGEATTRAVRLGEACDQEQEEWTNRQANDDDARREEEEEENGLLSRRSEDFAITVDHALRSLVRVCDDERMLLGEDLDGEEEDEYYRYEYRREEEEQMRGGIKEDDEPVKAGKRVRGGEAGESHDGNGHKLHDNSSYSRHVWERDGF